MSSGGCTAQVKLSATVGQQPLHCEVMHLLLLLGQGLGKRGRQTMKRLHSKATLSVSRCPPTYPAWRFSSSTLRRSR